MEGKKILIVEDVRAAHLLYEQALLMDNRDYEVLAVDRGMEALRRLKREEYNLVILDINLPDISGDEVLKKLRESNPDIPVLILTAFAQKDLILKVTKYGINDYLIKPVDLKILRKRAREILGGRRGIILKEKAVKTINEEIMEEKVEEINKKYIWKKEIHCPVCTRKFESYNYKSKSQALLEKESDFHEVYEKFDPIMYDIVVCPECHYANTQSKFSELKAQSMEKLHNSMRESSFDFERDRDPQLGIESMRLAILTHEQVETQNDSIYGNLYLKQAWLYRNLKDKENEAASLKKALEYYEKKYLSADTLGGSLSENGLAYLIAELSRRTGDSAKAQNYFNLVISSQDAKKEKYIYGLAKRQYLKMKEERQKENEKNEHDK